MDGDYISVILDDLVPSADYRLQVLTNEPRNSPQHPYDIYVGHKPCLDDTGFELLDGHECDLLTKNVTCGTDGTGTADYGSPCAVPFTYEGTRYNECTTVDHDGSGSPWCSTDTYFAGVWGNCDCSQEITFQSCASDCSLGHCSAGLSSEDCVVALSLDGGQLWDDVTCDEAHPYICSDPCPPAIIGMKAHRLQLSDSVAILRFVQFERATVAGNGNVDLCGGVSSNTDTVEIEYAQFMNLEQNGIGAAAIFAEQTNLTVSFSAFEANVNYGLGSGAIYVRCTRAMLGSPACMPSTRSRAALALARLSVHTELLV